jgi:hypothetical protein
LTGIAGADALDISDVALVWTSFAGLLGVVGRLGEEGLMANETESNVEAGEG